MLKSSRRRPASAALRDDRGITLTELLVTMMIFGVLMAIVMSVMITLTNMSKDTLARTRAVEEARLGVSQIDRQVRSGNVILDPENEPFANAEVPPFFSMRIYTQENGQNKCAQWRVIDHDSDGFGDLEFRTWLPVADPSLSVTPWSPVAHNLVAMDTAPATSADIVRTNPLTWPPFWVDDSESGATTAQFVRITLRLKDPSESGDSKPTSISTTVTGRNTVFDYPTAYCSLVPPA